MKTFSFHIIQVLWRGLLNIFLFTKHLGSVKSSQHNDPVSCSLTQGGFFQTSMLQSQRFMGRQCTFPSMELHGCSNTKKELPIAARGNVHLLWRCCSPILEAEVEKMLSECCGNLIPNTGDECSYNVQTTLCEHCTNVSAQCCTCTFYVQNDCYIQM